MAGEAVQNNLVLIIVPLFALLSLAIMFVVIPIFSGMVGGGAASAGLVSMSDTLASFAPIYGIGLAIGILVMFFGYQNAFAFDQNGCLVCRALSSRLSCAEHANFPHF